MQITRNIVRVFLASPGDLTEERKQAKVVVDEFNRTWANFLGYEVELIGWEDTVTQLGRPQDVINQDMETCELFVGVMWKHWGSPPTSDGSFSSGFEEEFTRSLDRNQRTGEPQMKLFFKRIGPEYLKDVGPSLSKVLEFRKKVISDRKVLFEEFAEPEEFSDKLRRSLSNYIQNFSKTEKDQEKKSSEPTLQGAGAKAATAPSVGAETPKSAIARYFSGLAETFSDESRNTSLPLDAVRLRLLASFLSTGANDKVFLEAHDANLAFLNRTSTSFSPSETVGLRNSGLHLYANENAPMWHWLVRFRTTATPASQLTQMARFSEDDATRLGAISALSDAGLPLEVVVGTRDEYFNAVLGDSSSVALRQTVLSYLGQLGEIGDAAYIRTELHRNDAATQAAAHEAMARLLLRSSVSDALAYLLSASFETLSAPVLDAVIPESTILSDVVAHQALEHRSPRIRLVALRSLIAGKAASSSILESALKDSSPWVRLASLQALEAQGRSYSLGQGKEILREGLPSGGLLGGVDAILATEAFVRTHLKTLSDVDLDAEVSQSSVFDQSAVFEQVRRNFEEKGDELRALLKARFDPLIGSRNWTEKDASLVDYMRNEMVRDGLTLLTEKGGRNDLPLVKEILAEGKVSLAPQDIRFIVKVAQKDDLDYLFLLQGIRKEDAKKTCNYLAIILLKEFGVQVSLERILDPSILKAVLISMSDRDFKSLDASLIDKILRNSSDDVRKVASLKIVDTFARNEIAKILDSHAVAGSTYYYNVVHWLDFGVSQPRKIAKAAASKIMAGM